MKKQERINSIAPVLLINGKRIPKNLRIYDNGGKTVDRYTAVFTGNYKGRNGICHYIGFSVPCEFWQHGDSEVIIDSPSYSHLGKKISFCELPEVSKKSLMEEYCEIWDLPKSLIEEI